MLGVPFAIWTAKSTIEPVGTGARIDMPSTFPLRAGMTTPIARAAPVEVGMRLIAAARARRRSLCGKSRIFWSFVYAWIVVMKPRSIPYASFSTFATGAMQLVVQDAFEMRLCFSGSYSPSLTPRTSVRSGSVAGAEKMTFFAPASRCFCAAVARVEVPGGLEGDVDAELAPGELRGILLGEELDLVAADADEAVAGLDRDVEVAEHGVVLQQVRHRLRVAEVVRRDDLEVAAALDLRAQEVPADAAEAVDPDPDLRHEVVAFRSLWFLARV